MLETTGGPCFRASNDLAGATRRAGGTDADDGCGEGTGAYPGTVPSGMTSPSSLVDVVQSKGQHPKAHLLDMGSLFSTSLSPHV
ncbi:hypothetical protein G5I_14556 [Acromyrmex echinatior]|uniref:Uncharacterized protein n=1 Tax=Acromyrmex echinatior TaxID=103372 RepID=F4X820_ACREC|nr:hypothetical protein G5I_14556 [Acromyrmex echinatior]